MRLELLVADLELEKLRLVEVALRALLGLMLLGLGLLLLIGFVLMLLWDGYRLPALGVLTLLCLAGGAAAAAGRQAPAARGRRRCSPPRAPSSSATAPRCAPRD